MCFCSFCAPNAPEGGSRDSAERPLRLPIEGTTGVPSAAPMRTTCDAAEDIAFDLLGQVTDPITSEVSQDTSVRDLCAGPRKITVLTPARSPYLNDVIHCVAELCDDKALRAYSIVNKVHQENCRKLLKKRKKEAELKLRELLTTEGKDALNNLMEICEDEGRPHARWIPECPDRFRPQYRDRALVEIEHYFNGFYCSHRMDHVPFTNRVRRESEYPTSDGCVFLQRDGWGQLEEHWRSTFNVQKASSLSVP